MYWSYNHVCNIYYFLPTRFIEEKILRSSTSRVQVSGSILDLFDTFFWGWGRGQWLHPSIFQNNGGKNKAQDIILYLSVI